MHSWFKFIRDVIYTAIRTLSRIVGIVDLAAQIQAAVMKRTDPLQCMISIHCQNEYGMITPTMLSTSKSTQNILPQQSNNLQLPLNVPHKQELSPSRRVFVGSGASMEGSSSFRMQVLISIPSCANTTGTSSFSSHSNSPCWCAGYV